MGWKKKKHSFLIEHNVILLPGFQDANILSVNFVKFKLPMKDFL